MPASEPLAPVIKTVDVACPREEAFRFFTEAFGTWWPLATHSCIAYESGHTDRPASVTFGTCPGGPIVEHGRGGEQHRWGTVLEWNPPGRVVFSWHPGRPEQTAQRVEVVFAPHAAGTRVTLTHSGWEVLGAGAEASRTSYNEGWESVLKTAFAGFVSDAVTRS